MTDPAFSGRTADRTLLRDQGASRPPCGFCHDEPWTITNAGAWAGNGAPDDEVHCPRCGRSNKEQPPAQPTPPVDPEQWRSRRERPVRPIKPFPKERDQPKRGRKKQARA